MMQLAQEGARHIAAGPDHLLFLLTLTLAAPLALRRGGMLTARPWREALAHAAAVATAFTLGQAVTLTLVTAHRLAVPAQPFETVVALALAASAWHAWRPVFTRSDTVLAVVYGLVHGLAFSGPVAGAGAGAWTQAQAVCAFSLGIEGMQLAVLAVALPPLLHVATAYRMRYDRLRRVLAAGAGLLGCAWAASSLARAGLDVLV